MILRQEIKVDGKLMSVAELDIKTSESKFYQFVSLASLNIPTNLEEIKDFIEKGNKK